jgi:hypothetical protein
MAEVLPYQALWGNQDKRCVCPEPVYIDIATPQQVAVKLSEFDGVNLLNFTYDTNPPFILVPVPDVKTRTLFNLATVDGRQCYSRGADEPYYATWSVDLITRLFGDGDIEDGDWVKFAFQYETSLEVYVKVQLINKDTTAVLFEETRTLGITINPTNATFYFDPGANPTAGYELLLTVYPSTVAIPAAGFCLSGFKVSLMDNLLEVSFTGCDGENFDGLLGSEVFDNDLSIINIDLSNLSLQEGYVNGHYCGYISMKFGHRGKPLQQQFISAFNLCVFDPEQFPCYDMLHLQWAHECTYTSEGGSQPLNQDIYIKGYAERLPMENRERIVHWQPDGNPKTVFNHSYTKSEIKAGVYGLSLHEALERAAENTGITANDVVYKMDASSVYALAPIGNGLYTGRIEMMVDGSSRIAKDCCCPDIKPADGCGELRITGVCAQYDEGGAIVNVRVDYDLVGIVNGTIIDLSLTNLTAISTDEPCSVNANTPSTILGAGNVGEPSNYVVITGANWIDHFDTDYCGVMNIQYALAIRVRCEGFEQYKNAFVIIPDSLPVCE